MRAATAIAPPGAPTRDPARSEHRLQPLTDHLEAEVPMAVRSLDLEDPQTTIRLPRSPTERPYTRLLGLVRAGGHPLGWISLPVASDGSVQVADPLAAIKLELAPDANCAPRLKNGRVDAPSEADLFSIVIATCADAEACVACVRGILAAAGPGPVEVIVVENRPGRSDVAEALHEAFAENERVRYVEERRPGLACARNVGLSAARGELVAFTDDDVAVDDRWVRALRAAFAEYPVDCVTGLIVPAEFETPAQADVERFAGYAKGFDARVYALDCPPSDEPLFPYAAGHFASGANMAFRTSALRELGGFDPHLGTGTPARGCEDLDVCIRLLQAGHQLAYAPSAIVWHRHPDTSEGFHRRVFDYGAALGAMLTKHVVLGADRWGILSRAWQGFRYFVRPGSRKNVGRDHTFPVSLKVLELTGVAYGPIAYALSRLRAR